MSITKRILLCLTVSAFDFESLGYLLFGSAGALSEILQGGRLAQLD